MLMPQSMTRTSCPEDAVAVCRDLTREYANTFYLASLLFDGERRAAVWALYAVCRLGDNYVDEAEFGNVDERGARLEAWWQSIQDAFAGEPTHDPVWTALAWTVRHYPVPIEAFAELYAGFRMDLEMDSMSTPFATQEELELYCRRVAGVVGLLMSPVCGYEGGEETLRRAVRLGQAMQLTNILRDVGEDLGRGRVYLPTEVLAKYGLTAETLAQDVGKPSYRRLMQDLVALARSWYAEAEDGIASLHLPARSPSPSPPVAMLASSKRWSATTTTTSPAAPSSRSRASWR
ncbi:MAG: phytoene/squalene synthase family protein [Caldilineaceae bacterium]